MTPVDAARPARRWRRRLPWLAPLVVAATIAGGVALSSGSPSDASPTLPARSAAQLLAAVASSSTTALSGQVRMTANLGLPALPTQQSDASLSWQSFFTGSHSARVWVAGPEKQRIAVLGQLSEADVVHNGHDVWTYTSATNEVSHTVLPATTAPMPPQPPVTYTPATAAAQLLKAVGPSTAVSVGRSQTVAGRSAYTLLVQPRDTRSTVREIAIAIDARTYVPLQVQVFGSGSSPALSTGFTTVSFATPPASTFNFQLPPGAKITTDPFGTGTGSDHGRDGAPHVTPTVIGSGWTSVVELSGAALHGTGPMPGADLTHLTTPVGTSGARLLHTALVNAVLLPDSRVFVGLVDPEVLEHIAATTPR